MLNKFTEFKWKIETGCGINMYDFFGEIAEAYGKGEIDCMEYIRLYEFATDTK